MWNLVAAFLLMWQMSAPLFDPAGSVELTPTQTRIYNRIKKGPGVRATEVFKLNKIEGDKTTIKFQVPGCKEVEFPECRIQNNQIKWMDHAKSINLVLRGDLAFGMIYHDDRVYSVQSLGNSLIVIAFIDQNKIGDD